MVWKGCHQGLLDHYVGFESTKVVEEDQAKGLLIGRTVLSRWTPLLTHTGRRQLEGTFRNT
jgi:hypothetical protein